MLEGEEFLFIENPKTGTTSMRAALTPHSRNIMKKHSALIGPGWLPKKRVKAVVVRNPFDRIVSAWCHQTRAKGDFLNWLTGEEWFVGQGVDLKRTAQRYWTHDCNHVIRYEHMAEHWEKFCEAAGIGHVPLGLENKGVCKPNHYRDVFTPKAREIVEDRFAMDLIKFRYQF